LGIAIPEAVAKRYDHAFPVGQSGSIIASVYRAKGDLATLTISDDGGGFLAQDRKQAAWPERVRWLA
jgi:two-component sensor histidine kinase